MNPPIPDLPSVEEAFIADMSAFLAGLDAGIAKASDFAQACKDAADGVAEITLAAEEMAAAVDASFASAIGSAKALDAQLADTAATMGLLTDKHIDVSASVSGISGPVAGAVVQLEALKTALAGVDDKTVKVGVDMQRTAAATGLMLGGRFGVGGWLTLGNAFTIVHLAAAVLGAQIVADAIGITAFGLAANSAIGPAVTAASSVANLTTQYAALDPLQKAATLSIKAFTDALAVPDETGIFGVFYQGLALVQSELGKGGPIVTQATNAFGDFLGMLKADLGSKAWAEVFSGTAGIIRTDLDSLFKLINAGIMVIPGLFHNLNFLGTGFLDVATGTLHAVAAVTEWNPQLTKAAALAGVAYGLYKVFWAGLGTGPGILQRATTGLIGFGTRLATASSYMSEGVGVAASYGLGIGAISSTALAATGGIAAFALATAGLYMLFNRKDAFQTQIAQMQQLDGAVGNNIVGYQKMDVALQQNIDKIRADGTAHVTTVGNLMTHGFQVWNNAAIAVGDYNQALYHNQQVLGNIRGNALNFATVLGVTTNRALAAANATGVDLTSAISKSGNEFVIDAGKMQGYIQAVQLSHSPLSQFKVDVQQAFNASNSLAEQVQSLNAAFGALVTPQLNVIQGAINLKASEQAAAQAIANSSGVVGRQTQAQQQAGTAIITAANNALTQSANLRTMGDSARVVIAPLQNFVSWLQSTGAHGSYVATVLAAIKKAEDNIYSKTITIHTNFTQTGAPPPISGSTFHAVAGQAGARGIDSARRGVALVGELGPELVFMQGGEQVIPHDVSRALLSVAGNLPKVTGYAGGTGGFWDTIIDKVWQDFQRILNRILGRGRSDPQYAAIQHLENEVRREFRDHKISKREELRLLKRLESIDDHLEFLAARHQAQKALSRDITGLLAEFAPKHHAPVAPAIQALLNLVKKDQSQGLISDRKADWLTAWLDHENKRLEKLLGDRARLLAKMATVRAYESQVSQAAQQQASLAGVISGLGGGPQSSATLLAGMQQQLAQIRRFDSDIKQLSKLGLDKALINQIIQMGPAQGSQVAEALINGPLANIAALNKTETQVQKASAALGNTAATAVYGSGKDFGKNFLKGLRAEEKAIEEEMAKIARNMVDVLMDALDGHHRHRRRHHHHHPGKALAAALGLDDRSATDSALRAAGYVPSALASAAGGASGSGPIRLDLTIHNYTDVDGKQIYKSVQERSLRIDRRNGRNNLSLTAGRRR